MNAISSPPLPEDNSPELAFEAMAQRLAGLTAAMDGFAARQQELHGRDYGPDLEKIRESFERVRAAVNALANQPAIKLRPEDIAAQIEQAGRAGRDADHDAWDKAQGRLEQAARSIETVVASALEFRVQRAWLAGTGVAAMVIGMLLGDVLPGWMDHAVPESWHWPEARAADMLGRSEWEAGVRLMQVADPQGWQQLAQGMAIVRDNGQALEACRALAAKEKASVVCKVRIGGEGAGR